MTHLDPELLALLALGEDGASPAERAHLADCDICRRELATLERVVAASRAQHEPLQSPGPRVWAGIAEALELDPSSGEDVIAPGAPSPRRGRRFRRNAVLLVAAAAVVLAVGSVALGLAISRQSPQQLAVAALHAFPAWQGDSGTAVLERLADGRDVVRVTTTVQPDGRTDHEVWLMTTSENRLVSLGLLHGTSGTFAVPAGIDVSRFRVVDVSDEPRDGNPAHSGNSIIRGVLRS